MQMKESVYVHIIMSNCLCRTNTLNLQGNEVLLYLIQKLQVDIASTTGFDVGSQSCLGSSCRLRLCRLLSCLYMSDLFTVRTPQHSHHPAAF